VQIISILANGRLLQKTHLVKAKYSTQKFCVNCDLTSFLCSFFPISPIVQKKLALFSFASRTTTILIHLKISMSLVFKHSILWYNEKGTSDHQCNFSLAFSKFLTRF